MIKLNAEHVILLHEILLRQTGGHPGIHDRNLLDSAINAPFGSFDKKDLYPTIECKAARLAFGIIKNHPFVDGNKRTGILAMLTFLELNGIALTMSDDELINIGLSLADGSMDDKQLLALILEK